MEDNKRHEIIRNNHNHRSNHGGGGGGGGVGVGVHIEAAAGERNEPVRSRWTPKPEQILILESIFNSGMVNPPKDETVRIRKLLEKFGSVGDANVFYWFQNRRSRSRRRQRQIQASLNTTQSQTTSTAAGGCSGGGSGSGLFQYEITSTPPPPSNYFSNASSSNMVVVGSSSTYSATATGGGMMDCTNNNNNNITNNNDELYIFPSPISHHEFDHNSSAPTAVFSGSCSSELDINSSHYHDSPAGFITVFINGVATDVTSRGPINMRCLSGEDNLVLFHSSGVPIPVNEYGFLLANLQHGESYFLVPRHS